MIVIKKSVRGVMHVAIRQRIGHVSHGDRVILCQLLRRKSSRGLRGHKLRTGGTCARCCERCRIHATLPRPGCADAFLDVVKVYAGSTKLTSGD